MKRTKLIPLIACLFWASAGHAQPVSSDASATGTSRAFNPAISLNALFFGMGTSLDEPLWDELGLTPGLHLQELSIEMAANIDIYLKGRMTLCATEEEGMGVEEAYLTSLRMPIPLTIRGGQMLNSFGRHNLHHLHHMAFAETPMIHTQVFGPDLNELSVEASYLVPLPWYMDVTAGVLNGDNEYLFGGDEQDDMAYLVHLDNLWDLSDQIALRLGGSYLAGEKGLHYADGSTVDPPVDEIISDVWGVDLQLKWTPLQYGRHRSFIIQYEYLEARLDIDNDYTDPLQGYFVQALGKFHLKWWAQARYEQFVRPDELHAFFPEPAAFDPTDYETLAGERYSFAVAYVPTEFSAYRIQYNIIELGDEVEYQMIGQVNVTMGSHPAHKY